MSDFTFELSAEEKKYLKNLAYLSIKSELEGLDPEFPEPVSTKMEEHLGAFVCLKINDRLRGCIGNIFGDRPLWETITRMAREAAFGDPRFQVLQRRELDLLELEISILGPLERVTDIDQIEPGKHGLLVRKGAHSGLLLPQVAVDHGWDRKTFLAETCRKASLPPSCHEDPQTRIFWFQAVVF